MSITNINITNVAKGTNLRGVISELRYEITALVTPEQAATEQFTFEIPNAVLVADSLSPPSTSTGNPPPSGGSGGRGFEGANIIAAIASVSPDVLFPSLQSKLQVNVASDEEAQTVLFRDPRVLITGQVHHAAAQLGLGIIPGAANPGISGTVNVNMLVIPAPIGLLISIAVQTFSGFY